MNIMLLTDSYKENHWNQYMSNTKYVYSYLEARKSESPNMKYTVFFGLQYILKKYLAGKVVTKEKLEQAKQIIDQHLGLGYFNYDGWKYILDEYDGYLPLKIKAVPEGSCVRHSNVLCTIENTDPKCAFLTNFVESLLLQAWYPISIATLSDYIKRQILIPYRDMTATEGFDVSFQLHDFGFRGCTSVEQSVIGGMSHLLSFKGTDTVPALMGPIEYYNESNVVGFSVSATEHSVMTARGPDGEFEVLENILNKYNDGILSLVIDSYNYENFIEVCGSKYRDIINKRNGKTVFRPDSGEPVSTTLRVINSLASEFGHSMNEKGYRVLPNHIGVLWGDGINAAGIEAILSGLAANGWSSENIVFGMGGCLLQDVKRDTHNFAFKCSAQYYDNEWHDVYKQPFNCTGKSSKRGRLMLDKNLMTIPYDEQSKDYLELVFQNGKVMKEYSFSDIRDRLDSCDTFKFSDN